MHEIINVSLSHRSNHLITQFYNALEPLLYDTDHENNVFLSQTVDKASKTVSYIPRALLWDARQGSGSLGKYQYVSEEDYSNPESEQKKLAAHTVQTHDRIRKSPYQVALDQGASKLPELDDNNAKYWSDYNKLIYDPSSLNVLQYWYHNPEKQAEPPNYQGLQQTYFDRYDTGYELFAESCSDDFFDHNLHQQLERCDSLQGFNLVTELDNGWGGFASSMLLDLKDELPKVSYHTYGWNQLDMACINQRIHSSKTRLQILCNKIRASVALVQDSDLFFPLYANATKPFWRSTGETVLLFDSINSLFHGSRKQVSTDDIIGERMSHLTNALTLGENKRNIVAKLNVDSYESMSFYDKMPFYKTGKASFDFTQCIIDRVQDTGSKLSPFKFTTYPWTGTDTVPQTHNSCTQAVIGVTEKSRDVLKTWEDFVSKYLQYDADREELKDQLGTLSTEYEHGWYDDEDSDIDM